MKLLLHCCCAPCTTSCAASLRSEGIEPGLFWYNPNIHPCSEYTVRRDNLSALAGNEKLELKIEDDYGLRMFLGEVIPNIEDRCEKCYRIRLEKTASVAKNGYEAFTTTLLISPYQKHESIKRIGEETADKHKVKFLYRDFRPLFRESQANARALGIYMQKYCGCIFSEEERYSKNAAKAVRRGDAKEWVEQD
jgi:predicted adenine nucleotide alpha hydrolase (AANH) superfamily ATPase